jgi:hypothetical protein
MDNFTPQEKAYFAQLFQVADADKDEKIGVQDAGFFRKAGLPDQFLGKVQRISKLRPFARILHILEYYCV